jgi:enoyl-CoA hydratase/3-hydroxyacyl-CoA dehydrogenase
LPGIGGAIVPYRKWPQGADIFHEMICLARRITAKEAVDIGMVSKITDDYSEMIREAVEEVKNMQGKIKRIPDRSVDIPEITIPDQPMAGKLALSKEAISIIVKTIKAGADADTFADALEIGYQGSAEIACTDAAKEGISAFLEKRKPEYKK